MLRRVSGVGSRTRGGAKLCLAAWDPYLSNRKIVLLEVAQWDSRIRNFGRDEHGEETCEQRDGPGEFRPRCGGITGAGGFARYLGRDPQDNPDQRDRDQRDNLHLLATPGTPLADNADPVAVDGTQNQNPKTADNPNHMNQAFHFG